jgi:hypothetical protein
MPLKNGRFTDRETLFVEAMAATGDIPYAMKKARYASMGAASDALARPEVQAAIVRRQEARLISEALPAAVATLLDVMQPGNPAGARVQAAKIVIDRAMPQHEDGRTKELHELTPEELAAAIASLEAAAGAMAKDVSPGEAIEAEPDPFG